jgi:far upstream element-binding protein
MSSEGLNPDEIAQRAKEIAARLSGQSTENGGGTENGGPASAETPAAAAAAARERKRKRWGVMPEESKRPKPVEAVQAALAATVPPPPAREPVTKRVWVSVSQNKPAQHFTTYLKDKIPEIIKETGSDELKIEFKGRGSSNKPPPPGMPEEPLHVWIHGPPDKAEQAETALESLLEEAEKAPVDPTALITAEAASQSQALAQQDSSYRPASVAQLIGQASLPPEQQQLLAGSGPVIEETVKVPNGVVGFIIGRGGENIASMQARTGCRVQIQKERELLPGQTERVITLAASTQEAVSECRKIIEDMVAEKVRSMGGPAVRSSGDAQQQNAVAAGHVLVEMDVPDADVGLVIGKGGGTYDG